jgi:Cys-rich four helix bundle protein (predicted Tat secretion target)
MERRELLKAVGMVSAVAMVNTGHADADPHEHHHAGPGNAALVDAAFGCVKAGDACLDHCLQVLSTGDKSMSECARSVSELVAVCGALGKLAAANSALLPKYAAVVRMSCDNCEKECRKHEDKHATCKACADACAACSRECAKLA